MTVPPIFTTFRFYRGTTFSTEPIRVKNPDGTPVDLTGWTGVMNVWREDDDQLVDTPLFALTSSPAAGLTIDGPAGEVVGTIDIPATTVPVDEDGEMWPFKLTLTNPTPTPDYVERLVQGYVIASR